MTYKKTIDWMFHQLPMYQRQGKSAFKKDLTNIKLLAAHLNHPERQFKAIHVAGTNGKGSVCHILASVLQEAGYKVGLHTSPHLKDYRERIKINGQLIPKAFITEFIRSNKGFLKTHKLSFFEMSVGLAFAYFAMKKVDIALIETGLGGRLDSTNIIAPELSIITNIDLDHTHILGESLPLIAQEKAGIIKPNTPVVIGEKNKITSPVFEEKSKKMHSELYYAEHKADNSYTTDLKGAYQKQNIQTAAKAISILKQNKWNINEEQIKNGFKHVLKNTGLQGRWHQINARPKTICDTAHNKASLTYVLNQLQEEHFRQLHVVLGMVSDKDYSSLLSLFPEEAKYYFSTPQIPRGLSTETLKKEAQKHNLNGSSFPTIKAAYKAAQRGAKTQDLIFIGGSTFTVAEVV